VFMLAPDHSGTAWTETVLYNFCSQENCNDGCFPEAGLIMDKAGNLYGTTTGCGFNGSGAVFELTPNGNKPWTYNVLYSFCAQTNCADGANPYAGVVMDAAGNLYGTTEGGGQSGFGTVFALTQDGEETVIYSFCSQKNCADGANPVGGLVLGCVRVTGLGLGPMQQACGQQALIGTTEAGGSGLGPNGVSGGGTVFALPPEQNGTWAETVLYDFCSQPSCSDGFSPQAAMLADKFGNLYGTTHSGGIGTASDGGYGVLFKLIAPSIPDAGRVSE
jgi:uncharacterized repeat protein (TIGR03803 family)